MLSAVVFLAFAISVTSANRFGHGCLPYRERFKLHFPCEEEDNPMQDTLQAWEANLRGEPSEFAKTGYYDRLFRQQNQIAYQGQYAYYPTYGYNANLPQDKPFEIINIAMGSREKVVTLYKTLYFMGKEYPKGKEWFHPRLKTAFLKNKDVRDPEQIDQLVKRGEYVVKELEALYKLKKYRTMKNRYYEVDPP